MPESLTELAHQLGQLLQQQGKMLATAESCTGGGIAQAITEIAGSSDWFDRGFVTYSNTAKTDMLGVDERVIQTFGAVSQQTAAAMATGALVHSQAQVSIAVTGIAGPSGGSEDKPVGTVWFGWGYAHAKAQTELQHFQGDRHSIRQQAIQYALQRAIALLSTI
jgi:nicotinamide-nucleotide amidase